MKTASAEYICPIHGRFTKIVVLDKNENIPNLTSCSKVVGSKHEMYQDCGAMSDRDINE